MRLALSTRWMPPGASPSDLTGALERLRLDLVHVAAPQAGASRRWSGLRAAKVAVASVAVREDLGATGPTGEVAAALAEASDLAAGLRAGAVVCDGGRAPAGRSREKAVDEVLRRLYGPLTAGAPLALLPGRDPEDLFGFEETGWALDALPRLSLWFDPLRAASLRDAPVPEGAPTPPPPEAWADRYAGRMAGIHVSRLPEEGAAGASAMVSLLPSRVPWVLDVPAAVAEGDLRLAIGYLRSLAT